MANPDKQTIELILIAVVALALVMQTIYLMALFITLRKAAQSVQQQVEELRSSVMPIINTTREVITRVAPKIESTADELSAIARSLRAQTADVQDAADDVIGRTQRIAARLDDMANTVLDGVEHAAVFVSSTVAKPIRQISGVMASMKAIVESLRSDNYSNRSGRPTVDARAADPRAVDPRAADPRAVEKDMFV